MCLLRVGFSCSLAFHFVRGAFRFQKKESTCAVALCWAGSKRETKSEKVMCVKNIIGLVATDMFLIGASGCSDVPEISFFKLKVAG